MLNLTLYVPTDLGDPVAEIVEHHPYALNVVRLRGACSNPSGDVISCMVPRESVATLLDELGGVGFDESVGTISLDEKVTVLGEATASAARKAAGAPADALVWPALRASTSVASEFSFTYLAFMVLATMLAAIGLLTSSSVLIVGAMILGPEFGALAHLCVSALGRDARGAGAATMQLVVGFVGAIAVTTAATWVADKAGLVTVSNTVAASFEETIVSPTWIGLVIACIAGIAGVLTLTSAKGEALIGVLVSVTTIPAAAEVAIGLASSDVSRVENGTATLLLNLSGMIVAGAATLLVYRRCAWRPKAAVPDRALPDQGSNV